MTTVFATTMFLRTLLLFADMMHEAQGRSDQLRLKITAACVTRMPVALLLQTQNSLVDGVPHGRDRFAENRVTICGFDRRIIGAKSSTR